MRQAAFSTGGGKPPAVPGQAGFGLMESLVGLFVFMLLLVIGSKAYKSIVTNHKEAREMKALTDAVAVTAEQLSAFSVPTLTEPGSAYLQWSAPKKIGSGEYHYRYRTIPKPTIGGQMDTSVVGLELETGSLKGSAFVPGRTFATLISPHLYSRKGMGQASTAQERQEENHFYKNLQDEIADLSRSVRPENQTRLNTYSCYDKGQCCGFMKEFFANPRIAPTDGLKEKCHYRCALSGDVSMKDWSAACGMDFCTAAPWKTSQDCCTAIAADECKPGSACARVCLDCVGENGMGCGGMTCEHPAWNDLINCKAGTFCDGSPLPDGPIPGWGDIKSLCKLDKCANLSDECNLRKRSCCKDYWMLKEGGMGFYPEMEICAQISRKEECCEVTAEYYYWTFQCDGNGNAVAGMMDKQWYCPLPNPDWNRYCEHQKGCSTLPAIPGGSSAGCGAWTGVPLGMTWDDPYPNMAVMPNGTGKFIFGTGIGTPSKSGGAVILEDKQGNRDGSKRDGNNNESKGRGE